MSAYERVKIKDRNHKRNDMPFGIGVGLGTTYSEGDRRKIAVGEIHISVGAFY